jgi:hypothetical protein
MVRAHVCLLNEHCSYFHLGVLTLFLSIVDTCIKHWEEQWVVFGYALTRTSLMCRPISCAQLTPGTHDP